MSAKLASNADRCHSPIIADTHLHTNHSHGTATPQAMYEAARKNGLCIIGFSEHSPRPEGYGYPTDYQPHLRSTFSTYIAEVQRLQAVGQQEGLEVLLGLEVDYVAGEEPYAAFLCNEFPYDYCIGSVHFHDTWGFDFAASDWEHKSREECFAIYAKYFQDLGSMCRTGLFQVMGHPDLVKIFSRDMFHQWLETADADSLITASLAAALEHGMAIEISSAGLRKPCAEIYPCSFIMERAARMQVPISFGSDAHCVATPGYGFCDLARYAAQYGYTSSLVFVQKQAQQVPFTLPDLLSAF